MSALNPTIEALNAQGQSVWYDNLSRDVLNSGELKALIDAGVSGLTSNPAIFKAAIADSTNYDAAMKSPELVGLETDALCEELMVQDVISAADLLRTVYDRTKGADGYASIEVSPVLAHDERATVAAAERLWKRIARPNLMVKIPATPEGIPAIRATLEKGINVNVTLIFSVPVYVQVANAYVEALKARHARGESIDRIASVASFFVSRVDAAVEKSLDAAAATGKAIHREQFVGKVGIANSKLAYAAFEEIFGTGFAALRAAGAMVQRPLWASTGTKNPAFSTTMYVEALVGRDTVNTMPPATVKATMAANASTISGKLHQGLGEAQALVKQLEATGVSLPKILEDLQVVGVKLFADAYRELIESIEKKRRA
jgi:transaldolase